MPLFGRNSVQYNSLRAKNIPAAGGVLPLRPDRLGVTGRREQEHRIPFRVWGEQSRGAGGLRRYGGRLAASGTTRLRPNRYSWKAEGEARGHLRTDTQYNA